MADLVVAGAGMAGLVAAAQARERGAEVGLFEKTPRAGGSMALSSGVIWRHREFEQFRRECPQGDERLQRLLFERLDGDLAWLEALGTPVNDHGTGNPATTGVRFYPAGLTETLVNAAGDVELETPLREIPDDRPVVLATGGFQADPALVREHITPEADHLLLRAAPGGTGDGLRLGLAAGASTGEGLDQFYGRNMPAPPAAVSAQGFVNVAQLYAHHATITNDSGERYAAGSWSEIDVVQWTARQPRARAWYRVERRDLERPAGRGTVGDMVEAARRAGAPVSEEDDAVTVETIAGITTTLGGLRIDPAARAAPGVFACGTDAGGIATGGYASGLAAALVFGRIAADSALGIAA